MLRFCNFGAFPKSVLRDRLVAGLKDEETQKALFAFSEVKLTFAVFASQRAKKKQQQNKRQICTNNPKQSMLSIGRDHQMRTADAETARLVTMGPVLHQEKVVIVAEMSMTPGTAVSKRATVRSAPRLDISGTCVATHPKKLQSSMFKPLEIQMMMRRRKT